MSMTGFREQNDGNNRRYLADGWTAETGRVVKAAASLPFVYISTWDTNKQLKIP